MKRMKKIASLLLAAVMVFAMGATAFAAPNDPVNGEKYTAYKIFESTGSGDTISYTIDAQSPWLGTVQAYAGEGDNAKLKLDLSADESKYVVTEGTGFNATEFAKHLATSVPANDTKYEATASEGTTTITVAGNGYYLITSSLGATAALVNDGSNIIKIVEKNTVPTVDKVVDDGDAYAQIGSKVGFTVMVTNGDGTDKEITLHDTMSDGLTLDTESFSVTVGGQPVAKDSYELKTGDQADLGDTFTIAFKAEYIKSLAKETKIVVTYEATVNEKAVKENGETNKATIDYSNQDKISETTATVETNYFAVRKYAANDTSKANLAGATFQLKQGDTVIKLVPVAGTDNEYRVAMPNEDGAVESFTTVADKNIVIKGVDSDLDYTLVETKAPAGYNLLTAPRTFDVSDKNITVVEVENQSGSTLPTTGGMGTTVLYAVGMILVLAAGVLLVVRRRMSASK